MVKLDHIAIFVADAQRSKQWYTSNFNFKVEFEVPDRQTVALVDDADVTLFLVADPARAQPSCALTLQVDSVDRTLAELAAKGVDIVNPPQKLFWGYGAEVRDPDGYLVLVWDAVSMQEKGS